MQNKMKEGSQQHVYGTKLHTHVFYNTLPHTNAIVWLTKHFSSTLLPNTCLQHSSQRFSRTLLDNTLLQHFSTTLFSDTSLQHPSPTHRYGTLLSGAFLYNTLLHHFSTTLSSNTSLILVLNSSLPHSSAIFLHSSTVLQHISTRKFLYSILLQHISTALFCDISLQHFFPTHLQQSSPTNTFLQQFSPTFLYTLFSQISLQHSSPKLLQRLCATLVLFTTLLYSTLLQHFSTTLFFSLTSQETPSAQILSTVNILSTESSKHSDGHAKDILLHKRPTNLHYSNITRKHVLRAVQTRIATANGDDKMLPVRAIIS